jgi:glycine oxidase
VDARPEVIVIGAGVVGCAVAFELARRGAAVQIVDYRAPAMGATQASAGVLAPFIEAREAGPLLNLTARSLELFDEFVSRVASDSGTAVTYRRTGTLDVATDEHSMRGLQTCADLLSARHIDAELLDPHRVRLEEPNLSTTVVGGLLIRSHGFVAAAELTRSLFAAARRHGAHMIENGRVHRIAKGAGELRVETERGTLTADRVVVAAGSWSGEIEIDGAERIPVKPVRGQLLELGGARPLLRRVTWGERCYLVPWEDGTLLVGATMEDAGFEERNTVAGVRSLLEAVTEIVPSTCALSFRAARAGLRPASPDGLPIIGPSAALDGVMYATAHFRNGILLAPLTAALVADAMLTGRIDPLMEATRPGRFGRL